MGNFLTKQWDAQGYYYDMTLGVRVEVQGVSRMIRFPKLLEANPKVCPKCLSSTGLQWLQMYSRMDEEREKFKRHAKEVIQTRIKKGLPPVYQEEIVARNRNLGEMMLPTPNKWTEFLQPLFNRVLGLKANTVDPEPPFPNSGKDYCLCDYHVNLMDLIVCGCMKTAEYELAEEDEESANSYYESKREKVEDPEKYTLEVDFHEETDKNKTKKKL